MNSPQTDTPSQSPPSPAQPLEAVWPWRRWAWVILAAGVAAVAVGAATWERTRGGNALPLKGFLITPPSSAYDFRLPDQDGRVVSLSGLRGKAVALTFLYTHCPDVCPLITDKLHRAYGRLGDLAGRVAFVAVSVDPNGDTPAAVREFLAAHHVQHELTYLRGSLAQLHPVWSHYYVGSDAAEVNPRAAAAPPTAQQIGHTALVYLIDPQGKIQAFLPANFDPADLVIDLRLLAPRPGR